MVRYQEKSAVTFGKDDGSALDQLVVPTIPKAISEINQAKLEHQTALTANGWELTVFLVVNDTIWNKFWLAM